MLGRSGNLLNDLKDYIMIVLARIDIDPILKFNEEELRSYIENIESMLPDQLEQSSYYVDNDKLIITNGKNGTRIKIATLEKMIIEEVKNINYKNKSIEIPTYIEYPDKINVKEIHDDIYREAKNAYYTTEPRMVYAESIGVDFDINAVENAINENPNVDEYQVSLTFTNPEITVNDLEMNAFPDRLATFSTKYVNNPNRTTNLRLASNKINGKVIMPGEEFSFNKVVGKRTVLAGYKNAAIFSDGAVTDGLRWRNLPDYKYTL